MFHMAPAVKMIPYRGPQTYVLSVHANGRMIYRRCDVERVHTVLSR